jgi:hypothetical protein
MINGSIFRTGTLMRPYLIMTAIALTCLIHSEAKAQTINAHSGKQVRVGGAWGCSKSSDVPDIIGPEAAHGKLEVRRLPSGAPCGDHGPMAVLLYTSNPGFKGEDIVHYTIQYIGAGAHNALRMWKTIKVR